MGPARVLPRRRDLVAAGRNDLVRALRRAGGSRVVARQMGVGVAGGWGDGGGGGDVDSDGIGQVCCDIMAFVKAGAGDSFPTREEMRAGGRGDLIRAVARFGGARRVSKMVGLRMAVGRRGKSGALEDEGKELSDWELMENGFVDVVRDRMGCDEVGEVGGCWELESMAAEGRAVEVEDVEIEEQVECSVESNWGHGDLRGGGGGILLIGRRKRGHHFQDFDVLAEELRAFIFESGVPGVMPTATEFKSRKRGDLLRACALHGGQKVVADRLGLVRVSFGRQKAKERFVSSKSHQRFMDKRVGGEVIGGGLSIARFITV